MATPNLFLIESSYEDKKVGRNGEAARHDMQKHIRQTFIAQKGCLNDGVLSTHDVL